MAASTSTLCRCLLRCLEMLIQLVLGVMSLTVMVAVAVTIAFEKLLTRGETVARVIGTVSVLAGIAQAVISVIALKGP